MNEYGTEATSGICARTLSMKWVMTEVGLQIKWTLESEQPIHRQARGNAPPLAIQNNFNCLCFRHFHPAGLTLPFAPHYIGMFRAQT